VEEGTQLPGAIFTSPGYYIKYGDDCKLVDTQVSFEVTMSDKQLTAGLTLEFELQFAESDGLPENEVAGADYQVLSNTRVVIKKLKQGVLEYTPVVFAGMNYCALDLIILAFVGGYACSSVDDFISIAFTDPKGNVRRMVGGEHMDQIYAAYCGVLKTTYKALAKFLSQVCDHPILQRLETTLTHLASFSQRIGTHDPRAIADEILSEIEMWTWHIAVLRTHLLEVIGTETVAVHLRQSYLKKMKDYVSLSFLKTKVSCTDIPWEFNEKEKAVRVSLAKAVRSLRNKVPEDHSVCVLQEGYLPNPSVGCILHETEYNRPPSMLSGRKEDLPLPKDLSSLETTNQAVSDSYEQSIAHLVVFVHGYRGSSADMQLLVKPLAAVQPDLILYMARSNEEGSDVCILEQGRRLANEVRNFMEMHSLEERLGRLSFVGYSMGGLVVRAAMPGLSHLSGKMHAFITISSPHLGFVDAPSAMLGAGMWFLKRFKDFDSLKQIGLTDAAELQGTMMYTLSQFPGLEWFNHVLLIGSTQDAYVPVESALIQVPLHGAKSVRGAVYCDMAKDLLSHIKHLTRLDVIYNSRKTKFFDNVIGRSAHIECLESDELMRLLSHYYVALFN
jgi:pimeloyl-ACP methyl ester carboxylesterase